MIRRITDTNGALAWRALITRYVPNTAPRVQSPHERNPQCKDLSLRAHSVRDRTGRMAGEHSQVGTISGDRFNASMKKALLLDKAPTNVRVPLQMQNLATFEAMTAVTLQFLQHNAQYQAGVTVDTQQQERTR